MGKSVLEARVVDIEKRRYPTKHYVYIIEVSWSEGTNTIIYRRYSKFFEFQCGLLEKFPVEAGSKNPEDRMIPFLPGKKLLGRSQVRSVAEKRLTKLNDYAQKLIRLPSQISDSQYVINFFEVTQDDINPPSKTDKKKNNEVASDISDPMLLEQFVAVADYTKQKNNECSLSAGQTVEVIDKNDNGWWFVHMDDFNEGWVPATYLEAVYGESEHHVAHLEPGEEEVHITTNGYTAKNSDELSFERGVLLDVYQKGLDGWWKARYKGTDGYVPACYLTRYYGAPTETTGPTQIVSSVKEAVETTGTMSTSKSRPKAAQLPKPAPYPAVVDRGVATTTKQLSIKPGVDPYADEPIYAPTPRKQSIKRKINRKPPPPIPKPVKSPTPSEPDEGNCIYEEPRSPASPVSPPPSHDYESISEQYTTIASFTAQVDDGLSFPAGQTVSVITKNPSGWYYVEMSDKEGWVPSSYLERIQDPTPSKPSLQFPSSTSKPASKSSNNQTDSVSKSSSTAAALAQALTNSSSAPKLPANRSTGKSSITPAGTKPPAPRRATKSDNNVSIITRSSLRRSSSTDSLIERNQPSDITRTHSPPIPRQSFNLGPPKPAIRKPFSNPKDDSFSTGAQKKFLRKSTENILANLTAEEKAEKESLSPPKPAPRRNTAVASSPKPPVKNATATPSGAMRTINRPKPPPPTRRTAADKIPSSSSTLKVSSELQSALQSRLHSTGSKPPSQSRSPATTRKGPTRPSPPSATRSKPTAPSRPKPPTTLDKRSGPPRPPNNPTLSRKPAFVTIADYIGENESSLGFKEGESVEVIEKNEDGWWYVSIQGREGWVPSTFIEASSPSSNRPKPPRPSAPPTLKRQQEPQRNENSAVAVASYTPPLYEDSGIILKKGRSYEVITKDDGGWWFVKYGKEEGWAPSSYLELL